MSLIAIWLSAAPEGSASARPALFAGHMPVAGSRGGNMERPALQGLLADIRASPIDIVVIYKVDGLTQPLADLRGWSRSSMQRVPRSCR